MIDGALKLVTLEITGPPEVVGWSEHGEEEVIEIRDPVECVDRDGWCAEGCCLLLYGGENAEECFVELYSVLCFVECAAALTGGVFQQLLIRVKSNRERFDCLVSRQ